MGNGIPQVLDKIYSNWQCFTLCILFLGSGAASGGVYQNTSSTTKDQKELPTCSW